VSYTVFTNVTLLATDMERAIQCS